MFSCGGDHPRQLIKCSWCLTKNVILHCRLDEVEEIVDERAGSCHTSGEEGDEEDCDGAEAKDRRQVRRPRPSRQPLLLSGGRQALVSLLAARWKSPYPSTSGETEVKAHQEDPHPMDDDPTPSQLKSM